MEIRSYRRVFDLERRIYSIDTLRLNPGGVPVRGLAYFLALLCGALLATRLPLAGAFFANVPWYLADLAAPLLGATVLGMVRLDGRPFHLAAQSLLAFGCGPRRLSHLRRARAARVWLPPPIVLLPDGSDSRMRRLRYTGPGAVLVACEHTRSGPRAGAGRVGAARGRRSRTVTLRPAAGDCPLPAREVIVLARDARLLVCPRRRQGA